MGFLDFARNDVGGSLLFSGVMCRDLSRMAAQEKDRTAILRFAQDGALGHASRPVSE